MNGLPDKTDQKTATKQVIVTVLPPPANQPPKASFKCFIYKRIEKSTIEGKFHRYFSRSRWFNS